MKDYQIVNETFNNNLYRFKCDSTCPTFFSVIDIDSINVPLTKTSIMSKHFITLLRVKVVHINDMFLWPNDIKQKITNDTLDYYLISAITGVYKLFGFYSSDLNYLYSHIKMEGLLDITSVLKKEKVLSNRECKQFIKTIKTGLKTYPEQLHKPSNLLKYYFSESEQKKATTILLPLSPLIPPVIQRDY